jgi:hypothetical protein
MTGEGKDTQKREAMETKEKANCKKEDRPGSGGSSL